MRKQNRTKFSNWFCAFALCTTISGCSDFLGILPLNEVVLENYWTNEDDVRSVVSSCYSAMASNEFVKLSFVWGEMRSDNIVRGLGTSEEEIEILEGNLQPSHSVTRWSSFYNVINLCNTVLYYGPDVVNKDPDFNESEWLAMKSEVLTIRSLCYFYLVRTFRDIPLVLNPTVDDNGSYQHPAADQFDVLNQIVNDLLEAERYAVKRYSKETYNKGRVTQLTVQALLADVYLWLEDYDNCIAYCNKVISSKIEEAEEEQMNYDGTYPLIGNQKTNSTALTHEAYNDIFGVGNSFESIFELQFTRNQQSNDIIPGYFGTATAPNNIGAIACADFIADGATSGNDIFVKTDIRAIENFNAKSTSFFPVRKYVVESINNQDVCTYRSLNLSNWIFYRLTDIMLLQAEALTERSQQSGDTNEEDLKEAFQLVSAVYNRANISQAAKDTLQFGSYNSYPKMASLVLLERHRELMFEGKRWFDLVRKARREGNNSAMMDLAKRKYTYPESVKSKWIKPDMLYFPINEQELKVNLLLKQNPGYDTGETIKKS
ncbi:MAG: RagB/SusD family nutrient uptake outer membrane protein [Bacteroidaceae bacterium]|nr:RagB/SusD family nutrient uptake outer membrane protein [Bacteroidaceae bacterium]